MSSNSLSINQKKKKTTLQVYMVLAEEDQTNSRISSNSCEYLRRRQNHQKSDAHKIAGTKFTARHDMDISLGTRGQASATDSQEKAVRTEISGS